MVSPGRQPTFQVGVSPGWHVHNNSWAPEGRTFATVDLQGSPLWGSMFIVRPLPRVPFRPPVVGHPGLTIRRPCGTSERRPGEKTIALGHPACLSACCTGGPDRLCGCRFTLNTYLSSGRSTPAQATKPELEPRSLIAPQRQGAIKYSGLSYVLAVQELLAHSVIAAV